MKVATITRLVGIAAVGTIGVLAPAAHAGAAPYPNGGNPEVLPKTATNTGVAPASAVKSASASTLPFTGGDVAQIAALGAASIGAGTFAVRRSRRRNSA